MTVADPRPIGPKTDTDGIALCAFAADGLCNGGDPPGSLCDTCRRYTDLLKEARDLYRGIRWIVTPEGMLQEVR